MSPYRDAPSRSPQAPSITPRWIAREPPLPIHGVAARGGVAIALATRLLALDDVALRALRGVTAGEDLVLLGDAPPWVDGATWLGRDPALPAWLMPTAECVDVPAPLALRALVPFSVAPSGSYAMWPVAGVTRIVPLRDARPIARARLSAWIDATLTSSR